MLEVDTPVLSLGAASEPELDSFSLLQAPERSLITSPEFAMKRLLAAGSGSIYRLGPAFRAGELGRWHNPEFCMLEWYMQGYDYHALMDQVESLIQVVFPGKIPQFNRYTVADVFADMVELNPHRATVAQLQNAAENRNWAPASLPAGAAANDRNYWLDLILALGVPEFLGTDNACFIYDYPESMASLTQIRAGHSPVAERFELYWNGVEIANGGNELQQPELVAQRFLIDQTLRQMHSRAIEVGDSRLISAHRHGLPDCAGVALGVDRLLALALGYQQISSIMPFSWQRS